MRSRPSRERGDFVSDLGWGLLVGDLHCCAGEFFDCLSLSLCRLSCWASDNTSSAGGEVEVFDDLFTAQTSQDIHTCTL